MEFGVELLDAFMRFVEHVYASYWEHWYIIVLIALVWHYLIQGFLYRMNGGCRQLYKGYAETFLWSLPFVHRYRLQAAKDFFFCGKASYAESGINYVLVTGSGSWNSAEFTEILARDDTKLLRKIASTFSFGIDFFVIGPILATVLALIAPATIIVLPFVTLVIAVWALIDYTFKIGPFKPNG